MTTPKPYESVLTSVDLLINKTKEDTAKLSKSCVQLRDILERVRQTLGPRLGLPHANGPEVHMALPYEHTSSSESYVIGKHKARIRVTSRHTEVGLVSLAVILEHSSKAPCTEIDPTEIDCTEIDPVEVVVDLFQEPEEDGKNPELLDKFFPDFQDLFNEALRCYPKELMAARKAALNLYKHEETDDVD